MDDVRTAEREILRYLIAHEHARDTIEGIEKWWLPTSKPYGLAEVERALRRLEERGLIRVWTSASADPVYGRSQVSAARLAEYLKGLE